MVVKTTHIIILSKLNKIAAYFFNELHFTNEAKWLRKLLAVFTIYKCIYWMCDYSLLFSTESMVYKNDAILPFWQWPAFLLFKSTSSLMPIVFLGLTFVTAVYILFTGERMRVAFFILWFGILNINNNVYPTLSGGDYLFQHLLFFCVFLSNSKPKANPLHTSLDNAIHNTGMIALRVQLCMVYFLAGYAKILDSDWIGGNAIGDSLAVHDYSAPLFYSASGTMTLVLSYIVIAYQLLFPVLIWIKTIKKSYLLIGVLQHLFIAFAMGLPSFGFIMIIAYSVFYVPFKNS